MSKRPKSLTDKKCIEIAYELEAIGTGELIFEGAPLDDIVQSAILELHPRDFRDLLERARDREAAAKALELLCESRVESTFKGYWALLEELKHELVGTIRYGHWKEIFDDFAKFPEAVREFRRSQKLARALVQYVEYKQWLVMFIGEGPDARIMRNVLHDRRSDISYELGEWLRKRLELLERTPEQIAADKAARREADRIYWDPTYIEHLKK